MLKKILALCVAGCLAVLADEALPLPNGQKMTLVEIPAGKFTMGSPNTENYRRENETLHEVSISKKFLMGKYEVTQQQYELIMGTNPSKNQAGPDFPVDNVSWEDAMAFCNKLTDALHKANIMPDNVIITLPTEAQWEYACRAGSKSAFCFGDQFDSEMANFDGNHPYGKADKTPKFVNSTTKVGSYKPNQWGLYDMHGNVMEWCADFYQPDLGTAPATDPKGAPEGDYHVYRGGGYRDIGAFCRSAFRYFNLAHFKYGYLGFRVICIAK